MQSNGGLTTAEEAEKKTDEYYRVRSGRGCHRGPGTCTAPTTTKYHYVRHGAGPLQKHPWLKGAKSHGLEYQVGGGIMMGSRLLTGAGYMLKVPAIDLAEVGAGGGSIVSIDAGGSIQVGPESAGAEPGPLCYDIGGINPTVTDANLILGYINPDHLVGGAVKLNAAKAAKVFGEKIAAPLDLSLEHAAYGAHQIAASNMMRAIKAVSTERGRDPRDYALFAFGGTALFLQPVWRQPAYDTYCYSPISRSFLLVRFALCGCRTPLLPDIQETCARNKYQRTNN